MNLLKNKSFQFFCTGAIWFAGGVFTIAAIYFGAAYLNEIGSIEKPLLYLVSGLGLFFLSSRIKLKVE